MTDDHLKAEFWIMAHVRHCNAGGVPAAAARGVARLTRYPISRRAAGLADRHTGEPSE